MSLKAVRHFSRSGFWLSTLGVLFAVVVILTVWHLQQQREAQSHLVRTNAWIAWQLEKEYLQFLYELRAYLGAADSEALERLRLRFDLLYSRPGLITTGVESKMLRQIPDAEHIARDLIERLDRMDAVVFQPSGPSAEDIEWILTELTPLREPISALSAAAVASDAAVRLRQRSQSFDRRTLLLLVVLSVGAMTIMWALWWQAATNRRLALHQEHLRKAAEKSHEALAEREAQFRHLVESTSAIPYRYDIVRKTFLFMGQKAEGFLGFTREQWLEEGFWRQRVPDDDRDNPLPTDTLADDEEGAFAFESRLRAQDGRIVWVRDCFRVVKDHNGERQVYGHLFDITAEKAQEQTLATAQRMEAIGRLTGGMAHDFNNLLTVVIGGLDELVDSLQDDEALRELAEESLAACERGAELNRQLLGFARRQVLEPKRFDLNVCVDTTFTLMRRLLGEQVEIRQVLAGDLDAAFADPAQVESALTNLAINARDAMPNGGSITVSTANVSVDASRAGHLHDLAPGRYVCVSVADTGCGIPEEQLSKVIEPFYTTKGPGKGTGLGLSMIYGFAKQSNGHVHIESRVGAGTTISLYLPAMDVEEPLHTSRLPATTRGQTGSATVLVVDDDTPLRRLVVRQLAATNYRVLEAADGPEALNMVAVHGNIDVLFTDVVMPGGMNGVELAQEAMGLAPGLRVLMTSGYADIPERERGRIAMMGGFLSKPYRIRDLIDRIEELVPGNAAHTVVAPTDGADHYLARAFR